MLILQTVSYLHVYKIIINTCKVDGINFKLLEFVDVSSLMLRSEQVLWHSTLKCIATYNSVLLVSV